MVSGRLRAGATRALLPHARHGMRFTVLPAAMAPVATRAGTWVAAAIPGTRRTFLNLGGILGASGNGGGDPDGKKFEESTVLPYTAHELYNIVADVDSYHEFLPYCLESRVLGPSPHPSEGKEIDGAQSVVDAELTIGFSAVRESYVSEVRLRPDAWVKAKAKPSALFHALSTEWHFEPAGQGSTFEHTRVRYVLHYAFASQLYGSLADGALASLAPRMLDAFCQRANGTARRKIT